MAATLGYKLKMRIIRVIILFLGLGLLVFYSQAESQKTVRVAIIQDAVSVRLKVSGFYEAIDSLADKSLYKARNLNTTVTVYQDGISLGAAQLNTKKLFIRPMDPASLFIDGKRFRGAVQFIRNDNGRLLVINHLDLEDYIKGILYHEVSHYWPKEALKAQAIVSRTYAVYQMEQNKSRDFDLTNDIYSQVYGGMSSERYRTNMAVKDTAGLIITYQDKPLPAYFHATCGGHTEDASLLWNINVPPLKGVVCDLCINSPHFDWHVDLPKKEIIASLAKSGYAIKDIKDITILGRNQSGRISDLKIISDDKETKISSKDLRNILGPNIVRSTNFSVSIAGEDVVFEGIGWGHGVGLCQWGAYFMAKEGKTYQQILQYYYPGTTISSLN